MKNLFKEGLLAGFTLGKSLSGSVDENIGFGIYHNMITIPPNSDETYTMSFTARNYVTSIFSRGEYKRGNVGWKSNPDPEYIRPLKVFHPLETNQYWDYGKYIGAFELYPMCYCDYAGYYDVIEVESPMPPVLDTNGTNKRFMRANYDGVSFDSYNKGSNVAYELGSFLDAPCKNHLFELNTTDNTSCTLNWKFRRNNSSVEGQSTVTIFLELFILFKPLE